MHLFREKASTLPKVAVQPVLFPEVEVGAVAVVFHEMHLFSVKQGARDVAVTRRDGSPRRRDASKSALVVAKLDVFWPFNDTGAILKQVSN